jgi:hypothetical protein
MSEAPITGTPESANGTCEARAKHSGRRCKQPVVSGVRVCRYHGGLSRKGIDSPTFKTGPYSKYLPKGLLKDYQAAVDDLDLLSLRQEIALADLRLQSLLPRLKAGDGRTLRQRLAETCGAFKSALLAGDEDRARVHGAEMDRLFASAAQTEEVWAEMHEAAKHKGELDSREWKRLVDMRQLITAERAMLVVTAIMDCVLRHTPEPQPRLVISNEIYALIASRWRRRATMGSPPSHLPPSAPA